MQCPICRRQVNDETELMTCLAGHMREEAARQAKEMQRIYLMMMASQLTIACVTTRIAPLDVVGTFGEVYGLLENLVGKSDVCAEIEEWLKKRGPDSKEA
ncbi:hypothetical protein M1N22_02140 [Dehalococcoidia bacterium]|nr:hypothetical protein [Dehalococcoidia bacterium]MCL0048634.1 hypothetical protein [Dehalococcoidia bacterium]MCL0048814.1 hypothetical protein [Dehalococcoidia bacterium]MCL0050633.1 hypothetical protein [Dehalococcoidia bacterium]MCL0056361.1 hypothetical protein [Dehalococcoidia bacterium]